MANHPQGREKNVTGQGLGVHRRGVAGTGSVGSGGRPGTSSGGGGGINMGGGGSGRGSSGGSGRPGGGGSRGPGGISPIAIVIILIVAILGGGGSIGALTGFLGGDSESGTTYSQGVTPGASNTATGTGTAQTTTNGSGSGILSMLGGSTAGTSTGWSTGNNTGASVDTQVAKAARKKYTAMRGNGKDVVTILVYLCGTDLESKHGMASRDLQEMAAADIS